MAYQTPKTNWTAQDVVQPADMNRIEGNIAELKKAATIDVTDANGYFTSNPKNIENVLQELGSAVTTGKSKIATAISAMGQSAASTDTFDTLSSKIRAISTDATAATLDVASGKTFYSGGTKQTGQATLLTISSNGSTVFAGASISSSRGSTASFKVLIPGTLFINIILTDSLGNSTTYNYTVSKNNSVLYSGSGSGSGINYNSPAISVAPNDVIQVTWSSSDICYGYIYVKGSYVTPQAVQAL
jgi:hypothetical protein